MLGEIRGQWVTEPKLEYSLPQIYSRRGNGKVTASGIDNWGLVLSGAELEEQIT